MKSYPKLIRGTLQAVYDFCLAVEKIREDDRQEILTLSNLMTPQRRQYANVTPVGNVGAGEDDLMSYPVPDRLFLKDGHYLVAEGIFVTAANANNKRLRAYLGSTLLYDSTAIALNNKAIHLRATVIRTGSAAQVCGVEMKSNDATLSNSFIYTGATVSLLSPVTFKFTGEATADNDIVQKSMTVRWHPANIEATA
jgi:hypothetical protein